jgi:hypothetical protein
MKTYGRFAVEQHGFSLKENADNGWLIDLRLNMKPDAGADALFDLSDTPLLIAAEKEDGLTVEVTPMVNGQPLAPVTVPANLMGDLKVSGEGKIAFTARLKKNAMDSAGAGLDLLVVASLCLVCKCAEVVAPQTLFEAAGVDVVAPAGDPSPADPADDAEVTPPPATGKRRGKSNSA